MQPVYLNYAATSPLRSAASAALLPFLERDCGHRSARHPLGMPTAEAIGRARDEVVQALFVEPRQVTFTSGGTEAANLAVLGLARAARTRGRHVLVGATEHSCLRACAAERAREDFDFERVLLDATCEVDRAGIAARVRTDTALVTHMPLNNETGMVTPTARMVKLAPSRAPAGRIAVDAVQAFDKLDSALAELDVDALFLSAHKLGGPKNACALLLAPGVSCTPVLHGGSQEHGLRLGTENVAAIVGFGVAARLAEGQRMPLLPRLCELRAGLLERLADLSGLRMIESATAQQPGVPALAIPGAPAEIRMHHFPQRGVFVSAGAACQSHARAQSGPASHRARRRLDPAHAAAVPRANHDDRGRRASGAGVARRLVRAQARRVVKLQSISQALEAVLVHCGELTLKCRNRLDFENARARNVRREPGLGSLPVGTLGRALCLVSSRIDSPVAAWMVMKRGCELVVVAFRSPPCTGQSVVSKAMDLVHVLGRWQRSARLYVVPFAPVQDALRDAGAEACRSVLYRRMMPRIATHIAVLERASTLVTGESVGQVASQKLENLACLEHVAGLHVLRPLVTFDMQGTIALAERIDTYALSSVQEADCCLLFLPRHPVLRGSIATCGEIEARVDIEALVAAALAVTEPNNFGPTARTRKVST